MAKAKTQKGQFMPLPAGFTAVTFDSGGERINVEPSGLYATWGWNKVYINYAGDRAQAAPCLLELPNDSEVIRRIAEGFMALADKLDAD